RWIVSSSAFFWRLTTKFSRRKWANCPKTGSMLRDCCVAHPVILVETVQADHGIPARHMLEGRNFQLDNCFCVANKLNRMAAAVSAERFYGFFGFGFFSGISSMITNVSLLPPVQFCRSHRSVFQCVCIQAAEGSLVRSHINFFFFMFKEGLEQKLQPPSPTKSKAEQPEDLQDDAEGGDITEEKQNTEETEGQSREADETKPSTVASLSSSEETELSENKDSLKDSKGTRESDPVHPVGCEQDQAEGQQDVSPEEEMKAGADSQSSCMEIEEPLLNQEDTTAAEIPLIHGAEEKEEEEGKKEGGGGMQGKEEPSVEPMKVDLACEAADVSNKDAEMNSQVENINDPTETEQEA
ncbi:MACD2 deacetylase, partial [Burhinus bistriatus]|nr:MACD2 deacetylase [Burhinus bistriatus]